MREPKARSVALRAPKEGIYSLSVSYSRFPVVDDGERALYGVCGDAHRAGMQPTKGALRVCEPWLSVFVSVPHEPAESAALRTPGLGW